MVDMDGISRYLHGFFVCTISDALCPQFSIVVCTNYCHFFFPYKYLCSMWLLAYHFSWENFGN